MPNDPLFADQWPLDNTGQSGGTWDADIDAPAAWSISTGSMSTVVAVLDTGIDYTHEDLYLNIWLNEGEIPVGLASSLTDADGDDLITFRDLNDAANAGFVADLNATGYIDAGDLLADATWADSSDTDGNGFVDDLVGWDTLDNDNDPMDSDVHGTMVAGILGAVGDNGVGIAGVNWQVRVMAMRFEASANNFAITDAAEALNYAVAAGASISSNSWGDGNFSQEMYDAIDGARAAGHLFVASAGNWSSDIDSPASPRYPAGYDLDNIIAVAAVDKNNELAGFSNWGLTNVDLAAPSPDVMSTRPGNQYALGGGTSSATPHVAGVAALTYSLNLGWKASQIKDRILSTVDSVPALLGKTVAGGRLNAAAAVADTSIHTSAPSILEGDSGTATLMFTATRRGDTTGSVALDWSTTDGTATAGSDYSAASGQVVFAPGETQKSIAVTVYGDTAAESHETLFVNLTVVAGNATLEDNSAPGTILNDEGAISVGDATAVEGDESMYFVDSVMPAGSGGLSTPRGILVGPDGMFYVSSTQDHNVLRYDGMSGSFLGAFTPANHGVLNDPQGLLFGPDGDLYVAGLASDNIVRYDGTTGELIRQFVASGSGGLNGPVGLTFGDDGDLYVASFNSDDILRFDGATGAFVDSFVGVGSGGLDYPAYLAFGPDGNLYVSSAGTDSILRYHSTTAAFIDSFVTSASGGLDAPRGLSFEPDGNLYVVSARTNEVLRYDGTSGAFINVFVSAGSRSLDFPIDLEFDENRNLVVSSKNSSEVLRYAPGSSAAFTLSISEPMPTTVTIDFATADGTAAAGTDYVATSGTVTFEPGQTERAIIVPTIDDVIMEGDESFTVNLSNSTGGATIADPQGQATILDTDGPLFSDSFENGEWNGKWVEDSQNDWLTSTQRKTDGSYSAEVDGRATDATLTMANPVDLTPYGSAKLSLSWFIERNWDTGEYIALDVYNGTWHNNIASLNGNVSGQENTWVHETIDIDSAYLTDSFKIRFRAKVSSSREDGNVDNVQLFATSLATPPNLPTTITSTPVTSATEDAAYSYDADATDPDVGDSLTFSLDTAPTGMTINAGTGLIQWTPTNNHVGANPVTVRVTDAASAFDTQSFSIDVTNTNDTPTITSTPVTVAAEGSLYTYDVEATDPDVGDTLTFSLVSPPTGMTIDPNSGLIQWTPAAGNAGDHPVTVRVEDVGLLSDTQSFTLTVNEANYPPSITSTAVTAATEDVLYSYDVEATDPNVGDTLTFSLDTAPTGMTINATTGLIQWTPTNDDIGANAVTVRVQDAILAFDTQSFSVEVANVNDPPTITSTPVTSATEDAVYSYDVGASDPDAGDTSTFSLDVAPAGMSIDLSTGLIQWTPTNAQVGANSVTVRVQDVAADYDTQEFTLTVADVNDPPTIASTPATSAAEDAPYSYDVQATDPDVGDTLTFSLDVAPTGMSTDSGTGVIQWTPTNAQVGTNPVTVRVQDVAADYDTQEFTLTVANVNDPPTITSTPVTSATEDMPYSYDVQASDPDVGDTLTYSLVAAPSGMSINSSSGLIAWTPTGAQVGSHAVTVRAQDDGGLWDEQPFTITVGAAASTKFYVVDDSADDTFEYTSTGTLEDRYDLGSGNNAPRGAAADATGNNVWVIDNDDYIYTYDTDGSLLRSWKASGLSRPEGIASDGEDLWIVDRGNDRVHFFAGGATRTTNAGANSNFRLAAGNPRGITTDGTHLWVVDTGTDDVYKYTVGGTLVESWTLGSRNTDPRGITIDPTNVSDVWVIDVKDDDVYKYIGAATLTSGSQSADFVFDLASGNTNPQGIADPPAKAAAAATDQVLSQGIADPLSAVYWADFAASHESQSKPKKDKATDLALMMMME